MTQLPPTSTLFPYTTLFRSDLRVAPAFGAGVLTPVIQRPKLRPDRKSTRLNSSHRTISYAVFCLKKKRREGRGRADAPRRISDRRGARPVGPALGQSSSRDGPHARARRDRPGPGSRRVEAPLPRAFPRARRTGLRGGADRELLLRIPGRPRGPSPLAAGDLRRASRGRALL